MANPYLQVLRTPHALPMVLAALIGRLPLSTSGANTAFLVATVAAALAAVTVALCQRLLHVPAEHAAVPALAR